MIRPAQSIAPRQDYPPYRSGETVALFIPCYIDQFFPQVGRATVEILTRLGIPIIFPDEQTCCGQPAFNSGYWDEARPVIRHFCDVFRPHRWIVSPSGSCTAMCRVFFENVDPDPAVTEVGSRVLELTEFLVEVLGVTDLGATLPAQGDAAQRLPHATRAGRGRAAATAAGKGSRPASSARCRTSKSAADSAAPSA